MMKATPVLIPDHHRPGPLLPAALFLLLVLVAGLPAPAWGQSPRWQVDVSGSRLQLDTLEAMNAPSLATSLEWQGAKFLSRVGGSLTGFQNHGWSAQGRGDLIGWLSPAGERNPARIELSGGLAGSRHSSGFDSYMGRADARLHLVGRSVGSWIGAGVASARNAFDTAAVVSIAPSLGLWARSGPLRGTLSYLDTRLEGERYPEGNFTLTYSRTALDVTAFAGYRQSPFQEVDPDSWAGISAAIWLQPQVAVVLSGGRYAPDIVQGLPGGDFLSLGIRYSPRRSRPLPPATPLPLVFSSEAARSGEITFALKGASTVEIAGDWNGWQPVPVSRDRSGRWVVPAGIPPGVYRFNLRVDGERWVVPEGVPQVDDGFGGRVGLLVISAT